ncbi:hypothetical protein [Euzebya tangerina]|uniref:hypothetical protein n=1 Tax=Euzebya tangerina TaxID=591198 RepID=UPI001F0CBBC8|nr:hypothetical protein [Euzebya tangerina]
MLQPACGSEDPGRDGVEFGTYLDRELPSTQQISHQLVVTADSDHADHEKYGKAPETRRELEDRMAALVGAKPGQVLLHLPQAKMMTKEADVRVRVNDHTVLQLREWDDIHTGRIKALNEAHQSLWRLAVYVHPDVHADKEMVARVNAYAADEFKVKTRVNARVGSEFTAVVFDQFAHTKSWQSTDRPATVVAAHDEAATLQQTLQTMDDKIHAAREGTDENGESSED